MARKKPNSTATPAAEPRESKTHHCRECGTAVAAASHCPEHPDAIVDTIMGPRSAVDLAESVSLARRLISLASEQTRQAQTNLDLAKVGLAELEVDLATRGIGGAQ